MIGMYFGAIMAILGMCQLFAGHGGITPTSTRLGWVLIGTGALSWIIGACVARS